MRIGLVCPYALNVYGGVQDQVISMSRVLHQRGHDVVIVAPNEADSSDIDTPATIVRLGSLQKVPANGSVAPITLSLVAARECSSVIDSFEPDVVHFHEPFAPLLGWTTLRRHRWPSVGTFHRSGSGPAIRLTQPILRRMSKNLDVACAVSEMASVTMRNVREGHIDVLFNGFETERFRATSRIAPDSVRLLTIGRLENRKGVDVAIQAVQRHNEESLEAWHLDIVGDGTLRRELERFADELIRFLGAVSDQKKLELLRTSTALICPARGGESFGLVLLEGMAAEIPVVASDIDGYRQAAGGNAFLARANDSNDFIRAINLALEATDTSIQQARQHAEKWSMENLVQIYESRYEQARRIFFNR